jgi:hypothetical protein
MNSVMAQFGIYKTGLHDCLYLEVLIKSVSRFRFWLKFGKESSQEYPNVLWKFLDLPPTSMTRTHWVFHRIEDLVTQLMSKTRYLNALQMLYYAYMSSLVWHKYNHHNINVIMELR